MQGCSIPEDRQNIVSLVCTLDQITLDNFSPNPPISPFSTGFLNKSDTELRQYTCQQIIDLVCVNDQSISSQIGLLFWMNSPLLITQW